jgi:hypothetical protein
MYRMVGLLLGEGCKATPGPVGGRGGENGATAGSAVGKKTARPQELRNRNESATAKTARPQKRRDRKNGATAKTARPQKRRPQKKVGFGRLEA